MNRTESLTYGLTHIAVRVKDLQKTKAFYQAVFNMEVMYEEEHFIQLNTKGTHDVLVFTRDEKADGTSGGIAHFGFRLREPSDIIPIEENILQAGGLVIDKGEFIPGSPYIFFKDPDGYQVEVWYELLL